MKRIVFVVTVLLVLALIGSLPLWLAASHDLAPSPGTRPEGSASGALRVVDSGPAPATSVPQRASPTRRDVPPSPPGSWQSLPPVTMPLAATWSILRARADHGDAPAACRLAADLNWCRYARGHRDEILAGSDPSRRFRSTPIDSAKDRKASLDFCAGVDAAWFGEQAGLTRQAALAGNLAAIEEYIRGDVLLADLRAGSFHFEDFVREAPKLADAAIQSGSLTAVHVLQTASEFGPEFNLLGRAMGDSFDPLRACQLSLIYVRVAAHRRPDAPTDPARICRDTFGEVDAATASALERQARDRFDTWFRGMRQPFDFGGFGVHGRRSDGKDANTICAGMYIDDPLHLPEIDWGMPD